MSVISVSPAELTAKARIYTQAKAGIENEIQRVNSMNSEIAGIWKGKAFDAYLGQYNQLYSQVKQFEALLESINSQLNKYADLMQQRDIEDSRSFGL
jgi:WXG100 family type VII secretion target